MRIILENNKGFRWKIIREEESVIYVKGYIKNESLIIEDLKNCSCFADYVRILCELRGSFAVIVEYKGDIWAGTDIARSIPLFFSNNGEIISDSAEIIRSSLNISIRSVDPLYYAEMLAKRNTACGHTVYYDILQLMAGEAVEISGKTIHREKYYLHKRLPVNRNRDALKQEFEIVSNGMMEGIIPKDFKGNIILPLSGGYDSRFIACMLKEKGYNNVICYTYGRHEDYEVQNSRMVAQRLGYEWYCVEYKEEDWTNFFQSPDVKSYFEETHNHCNLPHIQEYIALRYLADHNIINKADVVIPGFCGDFPAGSFSNVPELSNYTVSSLCEYIYKEHYINVHYNSYIKQQLIQNIEHFIENNGFKVCDRSTFISAYEFWAIQTRLTMWVVNSLRVYEHFDLQWRIPMWDNEYLEFWNSVPDDMRINCEFYRSTLMETIFSKYDVTMKKPLPSKTHDNKIKSIAASMIKSLLIRISVMTGRDYYRRNNLNNYNIASLIMLKQMETKKHYRYNSLSAHLVEELWWCQYKYGKDTYLKAFNNSFYVKEK